MQPKDFLTPSNPLGPFRQEVIIKRSEGTNPALLLHQNKIFKRILEEERPIVVGRRGAGKTSIVASLCAVAEAERRDHSSRRRKDEVNDFYIYINSWIHFDQLVDKVGTDARFSMGAEGDWSSLLAETVARHWTRRLWMVIFQRIYEESLYNEGLQDELPQVIRYINGRDIISVDQELTDHNLNQLFDSVRKMVREYLKRHKKKCIIIIDSLEEYPIMAPKFERIIAGLLKCVNDFNLDFPEVRIVCCIPEEIMPFFEIQSSNPLKDLSATASVSQLRWRPVELLEIVAERYRQFLKIHLHHDKKFIKEISDLDFVQRADLRQFFAYVIPDKISNRLGREESALAYIVRHTQLLPREFLMIFDSAIRWSHKKTGSWRYIDPGEIVRAVEEQEHSLATQVLTPYRPLFPQLLSALPRILPELPPICTLSDLDRGHFGKRVDSETDDPWRTLFEIGVLGYVDEMSYSPTSDIYEYARFHFNSLRPITFANDRKYCVHPIFSGAYMLRRNDPKMKCVYPADIEEALP